MACHQRIGIIELIECSNPTCKSKYHYKCVNITTSQYKSKMQEYQRIWTCPDCNRISIRHLRNDNTPVNSPSQNAKLMNQTSKEKPQESVERDQTNSELTNIVELDQTTSPQGKTFNIDGSLLENNTINTEYQSPETGKHLPNLCIDANGDQPVTLRQMSILLQQNNKYIIKEMRETIEDQIEIAINHLKEQLKQEKKDMEKEQTEIKKEISTIDQKITILNQQCTKLRLENDKLQKHIQNLMENNCPQETELNHDKMLVLYGLQTNYWETDQDLIRRITNIFYDILNVDISEYIDEVTYLGKRGLKRPIKIELISKRMKKYILENTVYFKNTGIGVAKYLNKAALIERNQMMQALHLARENGKLAFIRHNKLFIDQEETAPDSIINKYKIEQKYRNTQKLSKRNTQDITEEKKLSEQRNTNIENRSHSQHEIILSQTQVEQIEDPYEESRRRNNFRDF